MILRKIICSVYSKPLISISSNVHGGSAKLGRDGISLRMSLIKIVWTARAHQLLEPVFRAMKNFQNILSLLNYEMHSCDRVLLLAV